MNKKLLMIYIFTCIINIEAEKTIVLISIPKCGTTVFTKTIQLLTNKQGFFIPEIPPKKTLLSDKSHFYHTHLRFTEPNKKKITDKNILNFLLIRDPRDQLVSFAFWGIKKLNKLKTENYDKYIDTKKNPNNYLEKESNYSIYENLTFDDLLMKLITEGSPYYDGVSLFKGKEYKTKGVSEFYASYFNWMTIPGICIVKFEDLIGEKGGGDALKQLSTLKKISSHLNIKIPDKDLIDISNKLFGGTHTFRKGQIGSWKKYFKTEHVEAFKKNAGNLLIKLGYEKDLNW